MTGFVEYEEYDAVGIAELIRLKEVKVEEVIEAAISLAETRNPEINAIVTKLYDYAQENMKMGLPKGPFTGVPYLIKDLGAGIKGIPTTGGSRFMSDVIPNEDSETVKRLKTAGFCIFGKTNTCEFGMSITCEPQFYGATLNPWDLSLTPGGSSGGSASAVSARIVPSAHASDGFGSIRVPASCCGLVGMKPTRGRNSFAPTLGERIGGTVAEHAVSRTVRDQAAILDVTGYPKDGDPYFAPVPFRPFHEEVKYDPGRLNIAFTFGGATSALADNQHKQILEQTIKIIEGFGHNVEESDPPISNDESQDIFRTLMAANAAQIIRSHPNKKRLPEEGEVERVVALTAMKGESVFGHDIFIAQSRMHAMSRRMAEFHKKYDILLTPGLGHMPPKLGWIDMMLDDDEEYWNRVALFSPFTVWFNQTGQPAISLPVGQTDDGFPLSIQAVSSFANEATLFRFSSQLEKSIKWQNKRPKVYL